MRILLAEDEPNGARTLTKGLREEAYAVDANEKALPHRERYVPPRAR